MTDEKSRTILVIDDEEIVHSSIRRILSRLGYEVDGVFTAQEGLDKMKKTKYDAVITDLMMPELNGIEMLFAMKERRINIPTIMITGYPTIKTAIQALRLGAMDYIPKPFTRQELLSPLNRALRRGAGENAQQDEESDREGQSEKEEASVTPGECFFLPDHSWALYNQDGTVEVGVEAGFLDSIPDIDEIETTMENDLVEQGYPGFKIKAAGEVHGVFMPLSGRVVGVNEEVVSNPSALNEKKWILRIVPSQLNIELELLRRRGRVE